MVELGTLKKEDIIFSSSSITAGIVLAEPFVLVRGFKRSEQAEAPPAILRGSLVLQIHKPTKLRSINLEFKGTCRTEWPEGIPPLKVDTHETTNVFYHGWPFYNATSHIDNALGSPMIHVEGDHKRGRSRTLEVKDIFQAVSTIRSNSPQIRSRSRGASIGDKYRIFSPAEYVYNFELAIPAVLPETARCNFGYIRYILEATIERQGAFKGKLQGCRDVKIIRTLSVNSIEYSEPIVIDRSWEDILKYEIVVAGKVFALGSEIPISMSLLPLDKAGCHRIRIYITEHCEYYCKNRKVHRVEPTRRFLLLDKQPESGLKGNLLNENDGVLVDGSTQINLMAPINKRFPSRLDFLRSNISSNSIKVHHWIKISMRLSRPHPTNPGERKSYEISIDSPIMLVDPLVKKISVLPAYAADATQDSLAAENNSIAFQAHNLLSENNNAAAFFAQPDVAPPPIEAEAAPPNVFPPEYSSTENLHTYQDRYRNFVGHDVTGEHLSAIYWEEDDEPQMPNVTHLSDHEDTDDERDATPHATHDTASTPSEDDTDRHSSETANTSLSGGSEREAEVNAFVDAPSAPVSVPVSSSKEPAPEATEPAELKSVAPDASAPASPTSPRAFPPIESSMPRITRTESGVDPLAMATALLGKSPPQPPPSRKTTSAAAASAVASSSVVSRRSTRGYDPSYSAPGSSSGSIVFRGTNERTRPYTAADQRRVIDPRRVQNIGSRHSSIDSRRSSTSSARFFRQTSLVSVDMTDQNNTRYLPKRGGLAEPAPWYNNQELDDDQVSITVSECGADNAPLLDDDSELDLVDFDDDVISLRSRCPSVVRP